MTKKGISIDQSRISKAVKLLDKEYSSPRLGNKGNPVDELIYIILSTRTGEKVYTRTYKELHKKFYPWRKLLTAPISQISRTIQFGGMAKIKSKLIKASLNEIAKRFGKIDLNFLRKQRDLEEIEKLLVSLPGVGVKTAKCIMLYSLNKSVLPVDTHTYRIANRLGWIDKVYMRNERGEVHKKLESMVPPHLRFKLHVNSVMHGRNVCLSRKPKCEACCIAKMCRFAKKS